MAYIKDFESDEHRHERMSQSPKSNHEPWDNPTIKPINSSQQDFFHKHIKQYSDFISWAR